MNQKHFVRKILHMPYRCLEERRGLRKDKHQHEWGVPIEKINREYVLYIVLDGTAEMAKNRGEPYQELCDLRDQYTKLDIEEQSVRHAEFENRVAQIAPKAYKVLYEELDKDLASII